MTTIQRQRLTSGRPAVTAVFFLNGLLLASYIVRLPSLKADQHLGTAALGLVATLFGAAALLAMQFVGALVVRHGSRRIIRLTLAAMPLTLVAVGLAHGFAALAATVLLLGAVHGTLDVAMNAHAVTVEQRLGRPIMNGCHAAWSVSAVVATLAGAAVIRAGVTPLGHFLALGALVVPAGLVVGLFLTPPAPAAEEPATGSAAGARPGWTRAAVVLGLTGMALMICEGAALTWGGVFLHDSRGATLALASVAVTAFTAGQTAGRLAGDRLTLRLGPPALFRAGALVGAAGFALAVLLPHAGAAVAGFGVAGLGTSFLVPLTFSAAGHAGGAELLARFSTFTYAGILLGPAALGWIAEGVGLQWTLALLIPLLGGLSLTGLAQKLAPRHAR